MPTRLADRWTPAELSRLAKDAMPPLHAAASPANLAYRLRSASGSFLSCDWRDYGEFLSGMEKDLVADIRHSALYEISNKVETKLIEISAQPRRAREFAPSAACISGSTARPTTCANSRSC